jgi:hypothetical protein
LEATCIDEIHDILLLDAFNMLNNHFLDDYVIKVGAYKTFFDGALAYLDMLFSSLGDIVSAHKANFWSILPVNPHIVSLFLGLIFILRLLHDICRFLFKLCRHQ